MEHPENNEAYKGLTVNQGVEQPSIVNPYLNLRKKPKRRQYSAAGYVGYHKKHNQLDTVSQFHLPAQRGSN